MLFRASPALVVNNLVIFVSDLPTMQVNTLIGKKMADGSVDVLRAFIRVYIDESAVDVENNSSDDHGVALSTCRASSTKRRR